MDDCLMLKFIAGLLLLAPNPLNATTPSPPFGFYQCQSSASGSVEVEGDAVYKHRSSTFSWVWNPDGKIQLVFPGDDGISILHSINDQNSDQDLPSLKAVSESKIFIFRYTSPDKKSRNDGVFAMSRLALNASYVTPGDSGLIGQMIHGRCQKLGDLKKHSGVEGSD